MSALIRTTSALPGNARGRRAIVAMLALWALIIQVILPLAHGPHVAGRGPASNGLTASTSIVAHSAAASDLADCGDCPICSAIHGATQPIDTGGQSPALVEGGAGVWAPLAAPESVARREIPRYAAPRGPPAFDAC